MFRTIAETFPTLVNESAFDAALKKHDLDVNDALTALLETGKGSWSICESIAMLIVRHDPETPLSRCIPDLRADMNGVIDTRRFEGKTAERIRAHGMATWREVANRSAADLSVELQLFEKSFIRLMSHVVWRGACLGFAASWHRPGLADSNLPQLPVLAAWAQTISPATTLGEALALVPGRAPAEVHAALDALEATPLTAITGRRDVEAHFADAFESLLASIGGERQVAILQARLAQPPLATLNELATRFGITRERVRQLQLRAEKTLRSAVSEPPQAPVEWRAHELRRRLGTSIRFASPEARAALDEQLRGLPEHHRDLAGAVLLWLAGPYELSRATGWLHCVTVSEAGPPADPAFLLSVADEEGRVDIEALGERLRVAGLVECARREWIEQERGIRQIGDSFFLWGGTVLHKAATMLAARGQPMTAEEINDAIDEGHSIRALRGRLLEDDQFVRVDRFRIGLKSWGLEEYTGIADEIAEEIERQGGEGSLRDVVNAVAQRFNLRPASVETYSTVPRFVSINERIRLRRPDEPYLPSRSVVDEPGCYVLGEDRCSVRLRIDGDALRGSGRSIPQGLGVWLGVLPGARREFRFPEGGKVTVTWPDSSLMGPSLGSIRHAALAAGAVAGDAAILTFDRASDLITLALIRRDDAERCDGWERLALLTGIEAETCDELEERLVGAVGALGRGDLRARLRTRGESDLMEYLSSTNDPELERALDHLRTIL